MTVVLISAVGEGTVYDILLFDTREKVQRDVVEPEGFERTRSKSARKLSRRNCGNI